MTKARRSAVWPRQVDVLCAFEAHLDRTGIPPTLRELCAAVDVVSTNAIAQHVRNLIAHGLLERVGDVGASRALRLTPYGEKFLAQKRPTKKGA